jgi:type VI secretion system protein ImpE
MNAKELLDQGKLSAAIEQVTQEVRTKPSDASTRIFLFELLCFSGDLDRAEKHLDVIAHQSNEMQVGAEVYREVLHAEKARRAVFRDGAQPSFLTTPPDYAAFHLEALALQKNQQPGKARALLEKALLLHPSLPGQVDGKPFEEFEDSDVFLGPFLELLVNNRYAWLPFEQIASIEISKPAHLRDLLWARAKLEAKRGDLGEVFLPVLYPGSGENPNEAVKLGRMTDWLDVGEGLTRGCGHRMFLIDGAERAMLEVFQIIFGASSEKAEN